ncbi:MAG: bifunctional DNA primase/polymerase [Planctomycetia bacterium]|nr:bifunctional DNA primase/polymerase [Planctomycetia bacterium]
MDDVSQPGQEHSQQGGGTTRLAAERYTLRGWSVIPVPYRSKNPGFSGWERLRLTTSNLCDHFNGQPQNIGVLLGEPSSWLIDIDLDHPRAVELAPQFLPPTEAIFGRPGKQRSHWLYRTTAPVATKKHKSKSAGMIVELRSTGMQTIFPPSTHESGEPITWVNEAAEPAPVDAGNLLGAVERLANVVRIELGERAAPKPQERTAKPAAAALRTKTKLKGDGIATCLDAMLRMKVDDHNDGSGRLFAAACRVVEHDLSDADAVAIIREYARQKPFPKDWSDKQILDRIHDAEKRVQRGVIRRGSAPDGRPNIVIDTDEHRVVSETVAALAADPEAYQRGGMLVRVVRDTQPQDSTTRCNGSATISALPPASLRERMTKFASFTKFVRQGDAIVEVPTHPTTWLVSAVHARADWPGIRYLAGISDVPILRSDGTLWQKPGYDQRSGVLFEPSGTFPSIPDNIGIDEVRAALEALLEIVCDFRFENDDHRAAWLGGLLTPFARFAFDGPAPLFLIDANIRGAGKGLLAQTIGHIVLGGEMPVSSYAHESEDMRKKTSRENSETTPWTGRLPRRGGRIAYWVQTSRSTCRYCRFGTARETTSWSATTQRDGSFMSAWTCSTNTPKSERVSDIQT